MKKLPIDKAFEMQLDYHYYEPIIYDLGAYFGNFNFRQLKRLMFVFSNNSMAYTDYYQLLEAKKRDGETLTEQHTKVLDIYKDVIERMNTLVHQLWEMPKTENPEGSHRYNRSSIFQDHYESEYAKGRRWIRSLSELENQTYAKYADDDKNGWGPTVQYLPEQDHHIRGINQNLTSYIRFGGHWVDYVFQALMESGIEEETKMIDCENYMQLINKSKELFTEIQLIEGLKVECDYKK